MELIFLAICKAIGDDNPLVKNQANLFAILMGNKSQLLGIES